MFTWNKLGHIFNPCDFQKTSWLHEFAQTPNTFLYDDFVRVYFTTRQPENKEGQRKSLIAYVDLDKNNLCNILQIADKPVLPLGELGHFDEFGTYLFTPIRHSAQEIYAYYDGFTCLTNVPFTVSIGLAKSLDNGETFKKVGTGPVFGLSLQDPLLVSSHKIYKFNDLYYLFYTSGKTWLTHTKRPEPIYKLKMATSVDGIHWERNNRHIIADTLGENEAQACPDIFYKNGKYHMFFCYRGGLDYRKNPKNSYRIGYASSLDAYTWTRDDSKAGIDISQDAKDFDCEMVAYPHVFEVNQKIYMLYVGNEVGRYGFGLAELKGDLT